MGERGLDQYAVRSWPSGHRHRTWSLLAHGVRAWQRRQAGEHAPALLPAPPWWH